MQILVFKKKGSVEINIVTNKNDAIDHLSSVFSNGPGDQGSIPRRIIPKTQKMVLGAALLYTQHYKLRIKGKVDQSKERTNGSYCKGSLRVTFT